MGVGSCFSLINKRSHHNTENDCNEAGITFIRIVVDAVGGGWGPSAAKVFSELAKVKSSVSGELRNITLQHMYQSLGVILHRENARAIHRRSARYSNHLALLSTAATLQALP